MQREHRHRAAALQRQDSKDIFDPEQLLSGLEKHSGVTLQVSPMRLSDETSLNMLMPKEDQLLSRTP
ncbi:MAG: hypothetical protein WBX22_31090 [Silvibacterium sp.]|jgi:hypothetical protein